MKRLVLALLLLAPLAAHAEGFLPGEQFHATDIQAWQEMVDRPAATACNQREYFCTPLDWEAEITSLSNASLNVKLELASQFINHKYPYKYISKTWASPTDIEINRKADCKDHAVAKMALLLAVGVPEKDMRVLVLRDTKHKYVHAVLMVQTPRGLVYLDDQLNHETTPAEVPFYQPIYSINFDGWWLHDLNFGK